MIETVIIEDEARTANELKEMIEEDSSELQVLTILYSVEEAIKWFQNHPFPDMIFADIQLGDGTSFDIFANIKPPCPIIFCTAYDEYLLDAFETNAIGYLLKPMTKEKVRKAVDKYQTLLSSAKPSYQPELLDKLLSQVRPHHKSTLLVNQRDKIIPLAVKDIAYFYLEQSVVQIGTFNHQHYFITSTLDELEQKLDPEIFNRANRQFLINRHAVMDLERFFSRKLIIRLKVKTPDRILVSKAKVTEFLHWMEANG